MRPIASFLLISLAAAAMAHPTGPADAQAANLASRPPDTFAPQSKSPLHSLRCELRHLRDGGTRVVITNTLPVAIGRGAAYSFAIMGYDGALLSSFEGPVAANLAPNATISEDFHWHIESCVASVRLRP